ncbi:MAG TPA: M17 family peptidase N-terminal domain-containing protein [Candidatus Limnocylindrales bacterium]|nr:M17 family peptidase N-terminal domain-containing protein [Candidatus Limnocylindrales bacterium]
MSAQPWEVEADVLVAPISRGDAGAAALSELDRRLDGALADYRRIGELEGKAFGSALMRGQGLAADWLLGMGIGEVERFDRLCALRTGAASVRRLAGRRVRRLAIWLPAHLVPNGDPDLGAVAELVARGAVEGGHDPATIYRESVDAPLPELDELILVVPAGDSSALQQAAERGRVIGEGSNRARRLSQRASNDVSPEVLADEATAIAHEHGLSVEVIGPEKAAEMGMGMFLAVGRGSDNPPRFIVLRSGEPGRTDAQGRLLAMIGKGVTFDSGGISIKPSDRMEEMKMDKTGACTVISAIATAATLAPGLPLMAVAPAVENMPGSHSTRPGDVVRALNGKVVEIQNTDAEGRLILGDALTYAEQQGATHLVDVATLTGAVERAFGKLITGAFAQPDDWWSAIEAAGERQAERYWRIPLVDEYRPDMDSWYADFTNTGGSEGSLVKSGLFLREFATRPWAHLDIGGSAYLRKGTAWAARGATGVTHATLVELALTGA